MKFSSLITEVGRLLRSFVKILRGISLEALSIRRLTGRLRGFSLKTAGIRRRTVFVTLSLAVLAIACTGQRATDEPAIPTQALSAEAAETTLALTVYNEGKDIVRDRREFGFSRWFNEIAFTDVAASIDPTSVLFKSLTDPEGTSILEQNYQYDLVDSNALYKKYLDQLIRVVTEDGTLYEGRLLSSQGGIILQDEDGQVEKTHSISAGLDYAGIGPEHGLLFEKGRVDYRYATDKEVIEAFKLLAKTEGIIAALESSHAIAEVIKMAPKLSKDETIVSCPPAWLSPGSRSAMLGG